MKLSLTLCNLASCAYMINPIPFQSSHIGISRMVSNLNLYPSTLMKPLTFPCQYLTRRSNHQLHVVTPQRFDKVASTEMSSDDQCILTIFENKYNLTVSSYMSLFGYLQFISAYSSFYLSSYVIILK